MKKLFAAGILALSLFCSTSAFAKDVPSIDLFSGDYIGVAGIELDDMASSNLYKKVVSNGSVANEYKKGKAMIADLTKGAIDLEKDIDLIIIAVPADYANSQYASIVELKKDTKAIVDLFESECVGENAKMERREENGAVVYVEKKGNEWTSVLDNKRIVIGTDREVKAILASAKAGKAAKPISANKALYDQYKSADKKSDIWAAFVFTANEKAMLEGAELASVDGTKNLKAKDIDAGNVALSLRKGLVVSANAKMNNGNAAADGSAILNGYISTFFGDPQFEQMGLGFLKSAVNVAAKKSVLSAVINLSTDNVNSLVDMASAAAGDMKAAK